MAFSSFPGQRKGSICSFKSIGRRMRPLAAARLQLTDPDGNEHVKSIWSRGPADEVLTFP